MHIVVTPEAMGSKIAGTDLYLRVRNKGADPAPVFAVEVLLTWNSVSSAPTLPTGFEFRDLRDVLVKSQGKSRLRVYRLIWDSKRSPLFAGIEEPLTNDPIKLPNISDLEYSSFVLNLIAPGTKPEAHFYSFGSQGNLVEQTLGQMELAPDSDVPWFRSR